MGQEWEVDRSAYQNDKFVVYESLPPYDQQIIKKLKPDWDWDEMDKNVLPPKQAFKRRNTIWVKGKINN